jgi:hypothetical protein
MEYESTRREILKSWVLSTGLLAFSTCAQADQTSGTQEEAPPPSQSFVEGTVTLQPGTPVVKALESQPALYITARPDKADNIPRAILDGSRGKPPPILAARISNPTFPLSFSLTDLDLTVEGASQVSGGENGFWWKNLDLVVSARWDSDGVAATRDPNDLVGRGMFQVSSGNNVVVPLQGRGLTGKFVTGKSK